MRLGVNFDRPFTTASEWDNIVEDLGLEVLMCAITPDTPAETIRRYKEWVASTGLPMAEVGVWNNPIAEDTTQRKRNRDACKRALALAEELNAACCVNISGSRNPLIWDGYDARNMTAETFDMVVESVQEIIDDVKPTRTCYSLEPMPWMLPSSPEEYLELLRAVNRDAFGVHLDLANMVNGLERYRENVELIDRCFDILGRSIRSIHIKDVRLDQGLPCVLREVQPGTGGLDLAHMLRRVQDLNRDLPVFVEHFERYEDFKEAISRVRELRATL